jgi:hypothetical protein
MKKLIFFVPKEYKEKVKDRLFSIGVGRFNGYDRCSFETLGVGQFRPLDGSSPFIGSVGEVELVEEYRVEMICSDELIVKAVNALLEVHPYEEPAYEVIKILTIDDLE